MEKHLILLFSFLLFSCSLFSKSGKVKAQDGSPIFNALVLQTDDHSNWVKTDDNGEFEIEVSEGDEIVVSALYYETTNFLVPNTDFFEVSLPDDPFLLNDEFHISFDHLRPGDKYSLAELKEDFTVAYGKGFYNGTEESNRAFIDKNESIDPNGTSLRVKFPKDKLKTSESGVDTRIYLSGNYKTFNAYQAGELYVSYWVKFEDGFDFRCGGKMPSLGGQFENTISGDDDRWKGRIMWRNGGSIQFYPELPHDADSFEADSLRFWGEKEVDGGSICTNEFTSYLHDGEWHNIELHYKLDDGTPTGVFEGWVDGGKGYKIISSDVFGYYRRLNEGLENLTINFIMISTFFGGSSEDYFPLRDEFAWFDEFRVSKTRINEYSTYKPGPVTNVFGSDNKVNEYEFFPNPTNGTVKMNKPAEWELYNFLGDLIKSGSSDTILLEGNKPGIYFIKFENGETKKLILK